MSIGQFVKHIKGKGFSPEAALILTIIYSGIEENDQEYLNSELFEQHCKLVNVRPETIEELWK